MRPGLAGTRREGFCNIDELSAAGMTHVELEMKESIKSTIQIQSLSQSKIWNLNSSCCERR